MHLEKYSLVPCWECSYLAIIYAVSQELILYHPWFLVVASRTANRLEIGQEDKYW
jgi:hypothetical protein